MANKQRVNSKKPAVLYCGNASCGHLLPGPYGTPGVSMSRADSKTLLCSDCGTREALTNFMGIQWKV